MRFRRSEPKTVGADVEDEATLGAALLGEPAPVEVVERLHRSVAGRGGGVGMGLGRLEWEGASESWASKGRREGGEI